MNIIQNIKVMIITLINKIKSFIMALRRKLQEKQYMTIAKKADIVVTQLGHDDTVIYIPIPTMTNKLDRVLHKSDSFDCGVMVSNIINRMSNNISINIDERNLGSGLNMMNQISYDVENTLQDTSSHTRELSLLQYRPTRFIQTIMETQSLISEALDNWKNKFLRVAPLYENKDNFKFSLLSRVNTAILRAGNNILALNNLQIRAYMEGIKNVIKRY